MSGRRADVRKPAMFVRECNERKTGCLGDVGMGESLQSFGETMMRERLSVWDMC